MSIKDTIREIQERQAARRKRHRFLAEEGLVPIHPDTLAVDRAVTLLGTLEEWDSETIEHVLHILKEVRPWSDRPDEFVARFEEETGRSIPDDYDQR